MKDLSEYLKKNKTKMLRNMSIQKAYEDGYTQVEIAKYLGLSKSMISKIIKEESGNSTPGV